MISFLTEPWQYGFFQRAMLEVAIVGVLCGLVGCFVVLRGLAFIGDALAHAVFPGVVLSYLAGQRAGVFRILQLHIPSTALRANEMPS